MDDEDEDDFEDEAVDDDVVDEDAVEEDEDDVDEDDEDAVEEDAVDEVDVVEVDDELPEEPPCTVIWMQPVNASSTVIDDTSKITWSFFMTESFPTGEERLSPRFLLNYSAGPALVPIIKL